MTEPAIAARPLYRRPAALALVAAGGALGTLARYGLEVLLGTDGPLPAATLTANLTGAFLLGLLLQFLALRGEDQGRRRAARLLLGTGVLGGYTTYSTFAVQAVHPLLGPGAVGVSGMSALAYVGISLAGGLLAAWAGMALAGRLARPAQVRSERS